jgi:ubiquinone/menaquinone biosynthesis methyltransferase
MKAAAMNGIYEHKFVEGLFDEMSGSYLRMNYITSFGFSERWRRQMIKGIPIKAGDVVADLMTGMGECWKPILNKIGPKGELLALDFSEGMLRFARQRMSKFPESKIRLMKENLFENSILEASVDCVVSGFGMKTFSEAQFHDFAKEVARILKPGGCLSLIEISVPKSALLRWAYMFYLKRLIPFLGWMFLGNPENYRMLGIYSERFKNAQTAVRIFNEHGLVVKHVEYFFGCASGVTGSKK